MRGRGHASLPELGAIVECSAEPSVLAGVGQSPDYAVKSTLLGAYHCLEQARRDAAHFVPAAELLAERYRDGYGVTTTVTRCGVIAGPWQMGRVDLGVFTHWMLAHYFGWPLAYIAEHEDVLRNSLDG